MSSYLVGQRIEDLDTPVLLVDLDALEENIARAAALFRGRGVAWRPHTKGQKVPAIAHLEIAAGAIGITCAKLGEAEVMAAAGIGNILIGSQVVGPHKAVRLAHLCRRTEVIAAVDSLYNVEELDRAGRAAGVRIPVVVELDIGMKRAGVQPGAAALELSLEVSRRAGLRYAGLMGWEGHIRRIQDVAERGAQCRASVELLVGTAEMCREAGLPVAIVSCGGTGTHEFSSLVPGVTEVQAGGIIFNDMYYSRLGLEHRRAMTVISTVTSRPDPCRIVTDAGKKTMSSDSAPPLPLGVEGVTGVGFSAEHGVISVSDPTEVPAVGDKIMWVVGYGDTTVALHDEMVGFRNGVVEVVWPVAARGKLR
jgi:D-serine deaminase-like pyridoxal phosphate-dependent protein